MQAIKLKRIGFNDLTSLFESQSSIDHVFLEILRKSIRDNEDQLREDLRQLKIIPEGDLNSKRAIDSIEDYLKNNQLNKATRFVLICFLEILHLRVPLFKPNKES